MTEQFISAFITLLVVIDPAGLGPIFIGLTSGLSPAIKNKVGRDAAIIAFFVLAGSALFGGALLEKLGISLSAFRIAGGLLLFAIAFEMVFGRRLDRKTDQTGGASNAAGIAAFPLGIPLMAGPGAITAMVLLAGRMNGDWRRMVFLIVILAIILASCVLIFRVSSRLERLLGAQGQMVFGRLLGVLLAALAVQYVADGILTLSGR
ncbi:MAG: MarC family protein [Alphaproteobacteria bacterium]|jgi:multiple antibiotic resistance protein|nr:MarC family protein [Alphaproteobacteria bacterium]